MPRRVFISYQHEDQLKAKGFNLLRWNDNVDIEFVGRHLLDPVDSNNRDYIRSKIKEQLEGTSVTVVLIGDDTAGSDWVADEIEWSQEKGNGLVGIRLSPDAEVPEGLDDVGAEILDWFKPGDHEQFGPAIERAAEGAKRAPLAAASTPGGGGCAR